MMKKFKKISAVIGGALLAGMTFGTAAAATFPAPFVDNGVADVAIVHGTGAGVSSLDQVYAGNIQTTLEESVDSDTVVTVDGGEAFVLEKSSDNFNFGEALDGLYSTLDDGEMDFLADGTYDDGDIDVDYEQEIDLSSETLSLFADPDYNDDEATVGFHWENGETILSYTMTLDDEVLYSDMEDTDLPLMGNMYYVLDASATQIDVLDTASRATAELGESVTVGDNTVSITYVDATTVKFNVNGETTTALAANEEYELEDGSYIVATEILYQDYAGGVQSAEFAIGKGKIELIDGQEAELNDEDIDGLEVTLTDGTNSTLFSSITLTWESDRDTFLAEGDTISMPGFGVIQLVYGGLEFPSDSETISVQNGEVLTIQMDNYDLPLMWYNDSATPANQAFGEENHELVLTSDDYTYTNLGYSNGTTVWWNSALLDDANTTNASTTVAETALNLSEDDRFLVTLIGDDLSDVETGYYEVSLIDVDDADTWTIEFNDLIGNNDLVFENDIDEEDEIGDITVTHAAFNAGDNTSAIFEFSTTTGDTIAFNKAVSENGLVLTFPTTITDATNGTGYVITFQEEDKDDDLEGGAQFTATIKNTSNDKLHVVSHNVSDEELSDDNWIGYVVSDLASKISFDDSADENDYSIEYYGAEVTADVQVVAGGEVSSASNGALGDVLVKDTEVNAVQAKNLIIVGGSCINTAAAEVLGVPERTCGDAFTAATGVGQGQFLIQSVADAYTDGKVALVVAGYDVADTNNAATYLRTQSPTTDAGQKYIGTSATEATLQVN